MTAYFAREETVSLMRSRTRSWTTCTATETPNNDVAMPSDKPPTMPICRDMSV